MWIARNKDGTLNLFSEKPIRIDNDDDMWLSFVWHPENIHTCKRMQIDSTYLPDLKWEDEPLEVKLVSKDANVIEMPSEEEMKKNSDLFLKSYVIVSEDKDNIFTFAYRKCYWWLKSKIVK